MAKKKETKPAAKAKPADKAKPAAKGKPAEKAKPAAQAKPVKPAEKSKPADKAKPAAKVQTPEAAKPAATVQTPPAPKPAPAPAAPPPVAAKPAASGSGKWVPAGKHAITPHLVVRGAGHAIDFYKRAFDAAEKMRMPGPDGFSIGHAEISIGDSALFLCDENPNWGIKAPPTIGGCATTIHLYVQDADATFKKAVEAGAIAVAPPSDMFWGDRYGKVRDPFGHEWSIATHKEDLSLEEIGKRAEEAMKKMAQPEDHEDAE
jgi:PhnB protein